MEITFIDENNIRKFTYADITSIVFDENGVRIYGKDNIDYIGDYEVYIPYNHYTYFIVTKGE